MKKFSRIFSAILIFCLILSFSGCGSGNSLSAYEIAKKNGFTGSESEWLASLKGDSAYDLWLKAGNTGTLDDFFASFGSTINNYDVNIEGGSSTTMEATSKGLLSVVSVYSTFTTTVYIKEGFTYRETLYDYASAGSGVIYQLDKEKGDAYVITNYHLVYDRNNQTTQSGVSSSIKIYLYGMQSDQYAIDATYVGGSKYYDIAVLKVSGNSILSQSQARAVSLADSDAVSVGETAIAVGNPEALGISATAGIVCVDSENIKMTIADDVTKVNMRVMRIDTAINSGNSGGALYNAKGELIGITNAKIVSEDTENIAYAIPSNIAVGVAQNIIKTCDGTSKERMQKCQLGLSFSALSTKAEYDSTIGKVLIKESVAVSAVDTNGIANGNILKDDIILGVTVDGTYKQVTRTFHVIESTLSAKAGDTVVFHLVRNGMEMNVSILITENCVIEY